MRLPGGVNEQNNSLDPAVEACINLLAIGPRLLHNASATSSRPPTVWLVRQLVLVLAAAASVALSIVMLIVTYEYRDERVPGPPTCRRKGGKRYRCYTNRAKTHQSTIACLAGGLCILSVACHP